MAVFRHFAADQPQTGLLQYWQQTAYTVFRLVNHLIVYLSKHRRQRAEATYMPAKSIQ